MQQITSPITAKDMNNDNYVEVEKLYKQTSLNLLIVGGLLFLLINLNINDMYDLINKPQYTKGIWVVLIISISKLMELALGTGNAILVNSIYYKIFFYLSLAMAVSVIALNKWLIALIGIDGAALATLIVMFSYVLIKVFYIQWKFKIQPFSQKTIIITAIIGILFFAFQFLNFNLHPISNIVLKSSCITLIYVFIVGRFKVSEELNAMFNKVILKK